MRGATAVHRSRTRLPQPGGDLVRRHPEGDDPPGHHPTEHRPDETPPRTRPLRPASPRRRTARHGPVEQMPARPRGLLEPCAATSGTHGSEEGGAGKRRPLSDRLDPGSAWGAVARAGNVTRVITAGELGTLRGKLSVPAD